MELIKQKCSITPTNKIVKRFKFLNHTNCVYFIDEYLKLNNILQNYLNSTHMIYISKYMIMSYLWTVKILYIARYSKILYYSNFNCKIHQYDAVTVFL